MLHFAIFLLAALPVLSPQVAAPRLPAPTPVAPVAPVALGASVVRPGQDVVVPVAWHASYDEALNASRVSGKPVMLFQLLGKLDDALC